MTEGTEYLDVGHLVQFYEDDGELGDQVAGYLLGALGAGGSAVVIATLAHRRAIEARLTDAGADLAEATRDGRYVALDAGETLHRLMPDGQFDPDRFERVIGAAISRAAQAGRPVRAYGEMVALLWERGLVGAAIELEDSWDKLRAQRPFSLLCSYPVTAVGGEREDFAAVCHLHHAVTAPWPGSAPTVTRGFAFSRDAPREARHFAVEVTGRLGAGHLADDVALVVTELAANAVVHAQTGFTVSLSAGPDALRISVCDGIPAPAQDAGAGLCAEPLHGLYAVAALARRWGVEPLGRLGKSVWAELRR
jgi:hypothetical protein